MTPTIDPVAALGQIRAVVSLSRDADAESGQPPGPPALPDSEALLAALTCSVTCATNSPAGNRN
jgi:hypothetical protein